MQMNTLIDSIYTQKTVHDAEGHAHSAFPASILRTEGKTIYDLVRQTEAKRTLEIGLAFGLSTLFICQAHLDSGRPADQECHTAFDPLQTSLWKSIGLLNLERMGMRSLVRFFELSSHEVLPTLVQQQEQFDFILVDGAHLFDYVLIDFWFSNQLIKPGGLLMLHDLWMPSVRKLLTFILRNYQNYQIEPAFHHRIVPPWRKFTRIARIALQSPFDLHSWLLPFTYRQLDLYERNYCVLRKCGDDNRDWNHYRPF
jgi:predicted O-methyltransferase YrrM